MLCSVPKGIKQNSHLPFQLKSWHREEHCPANTTSITPIQLVMRQLQLAALFAIYKSQDRQIPSPKVMVIGCRWMSTRHLHVQEAFKSKEKRPDLPVRGKALCSGG